MGLVRPGLPARRSRSRLQVPDGPAEPCRRQGEPVPDKVLHGGRARALSVRETEGIDVDERPNLVLGGPAGQGEPEPAAAGHADLGDDGLSRRPS